MGARHLVSLCDSAEAIALFPRATVNENTLEEWNLLLSWPAILVKVSETQLLSPGARKALLFHRDIARWTPEYFML